MKTLSRRDLLKKTAAVAGGGAVLLNLPIDVWGTPYQTAITANNNIHQSDDGIYRAIALAGETVEQTNYIILIEDVKAIANPGLVVLVDRADANAEGSVTLN